MWCETITIYQTKIILPSILNQMFDREDNNYNNKAGTPKIVFKRPGSRDANSNGGFPGLVCILYLEAYIWYIFVCVYELEISK